MYANYTKLWKLLIDRGISKTDLAAATGISTRVIAKLTKNESVTTDTLARICEILQCDISDIMEFTAEVPVQSLYADFKSHRRREEVREFGTIYLVSHRGRDYRIMLSSRVANKRTAIRCENGTVTWQQTYPNGLSPVTSAETVEKVSRLLTNDRCCVLVIRGKPGMISGLETELFRSVHSFQQRVEPGYLYVMSEPAFKLFREDESAGS